MTDMRVLAEKMLKWEDCKRELDVLEGEIKEIVMEIGKTQTIGNVRATFSQGRVTYDYEGAGLDASDTVILANSKTVVDWRKVCQDENIEPPILKKTDPSVSVKLLE